MYSIHMIKFKVAHGYRPPQRRSHLGRVRVGGSTWPAAHPIGVTKEVTREQETTGVMEAPSSESQP